MSTGYVKPMISATADSETDGERQTPDTCRHSVIDFTNYLTKREADLASFHPQLFHTNERIRISDNLLRRDLTPICIPPSWDLVQKYAGALEKNADGFDPEYYDKGKRHYKGDLGEAEFLNSMRNSNIGGILIGDVNSQNLLHGHELTNTKKAYYMPPSQFTRRLLETNVGNFQLDFLYMHPYIGILHIEVKKMSLENDKIEKIQKKFTSIAVQIEKQRKALATLFETFCDCIGSGYNCAQLWSKCFYATSIVINLTTGSSLDCESIKEITTNFRLFDGFIKLEHFLKNLHKSKIHRKHGTMHRNLLQYEPFQQFVVFLAGYRPNFFISPVQCALQIYKNIFTHNINTVNFYSKGKDKLYLQNNAKTTKEYLQSLKFVKNTDINFGCYKNFYLTRQQMEAIGKFNDDRNFAPRTQLILGPSGTGKSIILMVKLFICGQMEDRENFDLFYTTRSSRGKEPYHGHAMKLRKFIWDNYSVFRRPMRYYNLLNRSTPPSLRDTDVFIDEGYLDWELLDQLKMDGQSMTTLICSGLWGKTNELDDEDLPEEKPDFVKKFDQLTQLNTIFRSSRQIQKCFLSHVDSSITAAIRNGHNFDGVKVELYQLNDRIRVLRSLKERLKRLTQVEGCPEGDIGLFVVTIFDWDGSYSKEEWSTIADVWQEIQQQFPDVNYYGDPSFVQSLEFPVMIIVNSSLLQELTLLASRAMCHLIVYE